MQLEAQAIKQIAKHVVFHEFSPALPDLLRSSCLNKDKLESLLSYHELGAYLFVLIKDSPQCLPEDFYGRLENIHRESVYKYMLLLDELSDIVKAAKSNGIHLVGLKGFALGEKYYGHFGFRPLVDIDVLIREDQYQDGVRLLEKMGYEKLLLGTDEEYWRTKQCHVEFIKHFDDFPVVVELHWSLDVKRFAGDEVTSLWDNLEEVKCSNGTLSILGPEDTLISLALHQRRYGKPLNLKYVCDTGLILENNQIDWDYLYRTAKEKKFFSSLYFLLYQVQHVLEMPLDDFLNSFPMASWKKKAIQWFIKRYTFGVSIKQVPYVYMMMHFFQYDNFSYPVQYVLTIPIEQFAKFYHFELGSKRTRMLYQIRHFYFIYWLCCEILISSTAGIMSAMKLKR